MRPALIVVASVLALSGCARPPEGKPIVLRKRAPAMHVARPAKPSSVPAQEDAATPLSNADKEALFRKFESYLDQSAPAP